MPDMQTPQATEKPVGKRPQEEVTLEWFAPACHLEVQVECGLVTVSQELIDHIRTVKGVVPEYWQAGVEAKAQLLQIRPSDPATFGALKLQQYAGKAPRFESHQLVSWLQAKGVPIKLPVFWEKHTASIYGAWGQEAKKTETPSLPAPERSEPSVPPAEPADKPKTLGSAEAPKVVSKAGGHQWVETKLRGSNGHRMYRCQVCWLHMGNLNSPDIRERPCYPGLYEGCYEVRGNEMRPIRGKFSQSQIDERLARLKAAVGEAVS